MKSKTKIEKQAKRKANPKIVETIRAAKKHKAWLEVASILSSPRRKKIGKNLEEIDKESKEGETIIIPGKVLSLGEMDKKIRMVALAFSEKAKEKLLKSKIGVSNIADEIRKNPEGKNIKILK